MDPFGGPVGVTFTLPDRDLLFQGIHHPSQGVKRFLAMTTAAADHDARLTNRNFAQTMNDDQAEQVTSGSGLGLAIVQSIIQLYGGQVDVQNKLGGGTKFTVWLPAAS